MKDSSCILKFLYILVVRKFSENENRKRRFESACQIPSKNSILYLENSVTLVFSIKCCVCLWVSQCQIIKKIAPNSFNKKRYLHRALSLPMERALFKKIAYMYLSTVYLQSVYVSIICLLYVIYYLTYLSFSYL